MKKYPIIEPIAEFNDNFPSGITFTGNLTFTP